MEEKRALKAKDILEKINKAKLLWDYLSLMEEESSDYLSLDFHFKLNGRFLMINSDEKCLIEAFQNGLQEKIFELQEELEAL